MQPIIRSTAILTVAHIFGYAISLAEVPILARALGLNAYGELLWVQATALLVSILVDYGFNLSAAREIAQSQNNICLIKRVCGEVFLAKLLLLVSISLPLLALYLWLRPTSAYMALAGFVYFVGFGMTPFWYFQGRERVGRVVLIEISTRSIALLLLIAFVEEPQDATLALWIMATASLTCTAIACTVCRWEVGEFTGSVQGALTQIRSSTALFVYKSSGQLMTTAATTMLGSVSGKAAVGIFAPTEKVVKAVIGLALPLFQAFYPHLSRLSIQNPQKKKRQAIQLVISVTIGAFAAAVALSLAGPILMRWMLGPGFEEVNQLLLIMVWLIPLRLMNQTLGFAVLLPAMQERTAGIFTLLTSALSLGMGALLATKFGAAGMVTGLLIGEALLLIGQLYLSVEVIGTQHKRQ